MPVIDPPFPLVLPQIMDALECFPPGDLETLRVYLDQMLQEYAKGQRGKRHHTYNWAKEAKKVLLLGIVVADIEDLSAHQLHQIWREHVASSGLKLEACYRLATPLWDELERLNIALPPEA